jgi:hypothetical protein
MFKRNNSMKTFTPTTEMIEAAQAVFETMAYEQVVEPIIIKIKCDLLEEGKYPYVEKQSARRGIESLPSYITDPKQDYRMSDTDFTAYLRRFHEECLKVGFDIEYNRCPHNMAKLARMDTERELINIMSPTTGMTYEQLWRSANAIENSKQAVNLTLKLFAPLVKKQIVYTK